MLLITYFACTNTSSSKHTRELTEKVILGFSQFYSIKQWLKKLE